MPESNSWFVFTKGMKLQILIFITKESTTFNRNLTDDKVDVLWQKCEGRRNFESKDCTEVSQMETISFASQPVMHLQKAGWKKEEKKIPLMVTNKTIKKIPHRMLFKDSFLLTRFKTKASWNKKINSEKNIVVGFPSVYFFVF